jgi:DNA polymerase V
MGHIAFLNGADFYISCERLFNPGLEGKPIIVLSNDRCVAARSPEAAQLKIPLGIPYLEIKDFCSHNRVHICLADYKLYGELSQKMLDILVETGLELEICSLDEAFIRFPEAMSVEAVETLCTDIRQKILKWTGLPVTIGLAPTKTLAKIAHQKARNNGLPVISLCCSYERQLILETFPIEEVWGISEEHLVLLNQLDVHTAQQFCDQDSLLIRQKMGSAMERTLWELRGLSCLIMDERLLPKHVISYSHAFDGGVTSIEELFEPLSTYAEIACAKLKQQKAYVQAVYVFLETDKQRYYSYAVSIPTTAQQTNLIVAQTKSCLQKIYQEKEVYRKCGIVFVDLRQYDNFVSFQKELCPKHARFNEALDSINAYFAKDAVYISERGSKQEWKTRSDKRLQYSNSRSGLAFVKA